MIQQELVLSQMRALARAVAELQEVRTVTELRERAFAALQSFQPDSLIAFERLKLSGEDYEAVLSHHDSRTKNLEILVDLFHHHPYAHYLNAGGSELAVRPTDLIPEEEWRHNPILNELYIPNKISHGMFSRVYVLETSHSYTYTVLREKEFSDTEQALTRAYLEEMKRTFTKLHYQSPGMEADLTANGPSWGLTKRELEVMVQVAQGKPNKDIAFALGNSYRTVNNILTNIFKKLGVRTRGEAMHKLAKGPKLS